VSASARTNAKAAGSDEFGVVLVVVGVEFGGVGVEFGAEDAAFGTESAAAAGVGGGDSDFAACAAGGSD